ncbi:MAG TPA: hypothetical protein VI072_25870, partial [Polyangiaceae bacterium]
TLNGSVTGAESWSSPSVYLSSEAIDFNGLNEHATLNLGPAPAGTADLRVSDVQVSHDPSTDQRRYTVTITNAGPAAAGSAEDRLEFVLDGPQSALLVSLQGPPTFECGFGTTSGYCYSAEPLASGASATFEFVRQGPFQDGQYPYVGIRAPIGTPDPNPQNNFRYLDAPPP